MGIVMLTVMILTLAERKVLGWMQDRMGPMEVGPYGILQPIADGLKLFFKEDIVPAGANKFHVHPGADPGHGARHDRIRRHSLRSEHDL